MARPTRTHAEETAVVAVWLLVIVDVVLLGAVTIQTRVEAGQSRAADDLSQRTWFNESLNLTAALSVSLILTWVALFVATRRSTWSLAMITAGGLAVIAVVLNLATYWACAQGYRQWTGTFGWVLYSFTGAVESDSSAGTPCAANFAPGSQLARTAALLAIFSGAFAAFTLLWRQPFDRLAAFFAGDVDVVVGLSRRTLPLIEALSEQNSTRPRRETWIGTFRWKDWRAYSHLRTKVVVFDSGTDKELRDEARLWGAVVLPSSSADVDTLRGILGKRVLYAPWRRHTAVRRFYAVDDTVQINAEAYRDAVAVLVDKSLRKRPDTVVPRLSLRLDSARDAREWRTREISNRLAQTPTAVPASAGATSTSTEVPYYSDALCAERVMAADIVERVMSLDDDHYPDDGPTHVWIYGEGTLALALAEEFAWQLWARYEVRAQAVLRSAAEFGRASRALKRSSRAVEEARVAVNQLPRAKEAGTLAAVADAANNLREAKVEFSRARDDLAHRKAAFNGSIAIPVLRKVVFLGPGAQARAREWDETRSPYQLPTWVMGVGDAAATLRAEVGADAPPPLSVFDVTAQVGESLDQLESRLRRRAVREPGKHMFVFAGGSAQEQAVGRRLAYLRDGNGAYAARVFVYDPAVEGLASRPGEWTQDTTQAAVGGRADVAKGPTGHSAQGQPGGVYRFGPTLVRRVGGAPKRASDIATRIAHQQHRCFRKEWDPPRASQPDGPGSASVMAVKPVKAANFPWEDLGHFFHQENISQVWSVLKFFAGGNGWRWDRVGRAKVADEFGGGSEDDTMADFGQLEELAAHEHQRWQELRHKQGWRSVGTPEERNDSQRKHHLLVAWDKLGTENQQYNSGLILMIIARLYAIGVVPVRTEPRRTTLSREQADDALRE